MGAETDMRRVVSKTELFLLSEKKICPVSKIDRVEEHPEDR